MMSLPERGTRLQASAVRCISVLHCRSCFCCSLCRHSRASRMLLLHARLVPVSLSHCVLLCG